MKTPISLQALRDTPAGRRKENQHLWEDTLNLRAPKNRKPRRPSKHVLWMKEQLQQWCQGKGYELKEEHKFHSARKWRTDFFIVELQTCIEYEGIMSAKSRHTSKTGYAGDIEKYNSMQSLGLKILRFTILNYQTVIEQLENQIK